MSNLTVLELVEQALLPIAGVEPPSSLESTTDIQQRKLRAIVEDVARQLRDELRLPTQKRTYTFDLETGKTKYQLPEDFYRLIPSTMYDTDQQWEIEGPTSDGLFRWFTTKGINNVSVTFRLFGYDANPNSPGGQFQVVETPTSAGLTIEYDYFGASLFLPPNWLPSTAYTTADWVNSSGNIYKCSSNGTSDVIGPQHTDPDNPSTDGTTEWDYRPEAKETILVDEDLCVFDDNLMVLGIRIGYLEGTSKDTSRWVRAYEKAKMTAKTRWSGITKVSGKQMAGSSVHRPYTKPQSWSFQ